MIVAMVTTPHAINISRQEPEKRKNHFEIIDTFDKFAKN
jgi:hypothetical protein